MTEQLDIVDLLLIAQAILGTNAKEIARVTRIPEAESALAAPFASFGGTDFYEDPIERAAICCSRILRNHPLQDGNKRLAYECMIEMLHRSGIEWNGGEAATHDAAVIEGLASREISEAAFIGWLKLRVDSAEPVPPPRAFDPELWQRTIFESLRPIDPKALFNVGLKEIDFRSLTDQLPADFPGDQLVRFVDRWLVDLDPDGLPAEIEWEHEGVRLVIVAKGRGPSWKG